MQSVVAAAAAGGDMHGGAGLPAFALPRRKYYRTCLRTLSLADASSIVWGAAVEGRAAQGTQKDTSIARVVGELLSRQCAGCQGT